MLNGNNMKKELELKKAQKRTYTWTCFEQHSKKYEIRKHQVMIA